jgi:hypothetical protein
LYEEVRNPKSVLVTELPDLNVGARILSEEWNLLKSANNAENITWVRAFGKFTPGTQTMVLKLCARIVLFEHQSQRGGKKKSNAEDAIEEFDNSKKKFLDFVVMQWIMAILFGLFLLYFAKQRTDGILEEVGLGKNEQFVQEILTSPVQGATNTILSILQKLGSRFEAEAVFEAKHICGNPTSVLSGNAMDRIHGALTGILSVYYSPGSTANCLIESTAETAQHLRHMTTIKLTHDFNQTTNLVRAAYAVISPGVACIARYILTGVKTDLASWTKSNKVPRITNGGRKRRRTRTRKNTRRRTKRSRSHTRAKAWLD